MALNSPQTRFLVSPRDGAESPADDAIRNFDFTTPSSKGSQNTSGISTPIFEPSKRKQNLRFAAHASLNRRLPFSVFQKKLDILKEHASEEEIIQLFGSRYSLSEEEVKAKLESQGILPDRKDVREIFDKFNRTHNGSIPLHEITNLPEDNLVKKALTNQLAVQNWSQFVEDLKDMYREVEPIRSGANAGYIPTLRDANPEQFGISICTVDGQQFSYGDYSTNASIQSCVKPLVYALVCEELDIEEVHKWVGVEPSGLAFNEISLNNRERPHNPMINSGAIQCCGLLKSELPPSTRFRYLMDKLSELAGGRKLGFSQQTYLGEHETAYRNFAIIHYMRHANAFPPETEDIEQELDFYLQSCSIDVNCESLAVIAATFANRGTCPLTHKTCLSPWVVKSTLCLMLSCGMYDYSGEWCSNVGVPAKSGVAGWVYIVIPNVLGACIFSPRLDVRGNSVRGIEFCKVLMKKYQFGIFDRVVKSLKESSDTKIKKKKKRSGRTLIRIFQNKVLLYKEGFQSMLDSNKSTLSREFLERLLAGEGIDSRIKSVRTLLDNMFNTAGSKDLEFKHLFENQQNEENLVLKLMINNLAVPNFRSFVSDFVPMFEKASLCSEGQMPVSEYEELRRVSHQNFGVAFCSVDGQFYGHGDYHLDFPLLSCVQPLIYALACRDLGIDEVHKHVGREPTSLNPHGFDLGRDGKPLNPFMDSGCLSILSRVVPDADSGARYLHVLNFLNKMSGDGKVGFNQPLFLELKSKSHMLKAVSNVLRGLDQLGPGVRPIQATTQYSEAQSMEMNCQQLAVVAATFANGGINPVTGETILEPKTVKSLMSLMYASGMKQYAGTWNFEVGIPAVAGESGCMMVVIPNVMGMAIYSPRLNPYYVSCRGIELCKLLASKFRFSIFDQLVYGDQDFVIPESRRQEKKQQREKEMVFYAFTMACATGNINKVREMISKNSSLVQQADYDGRTPLHLGASEGHYEIVKLLLECGAPKNPVDRWGNTPANDAASNGHPEILKLLEEF